MIPREYTFGRTARRTATVAVPLLATATGTAAAHGGGGTGGGMMDGGGWGVVGGTMVLWGLLWMGLLVALPLLLGYAFLVRGSGASADRPFALLRERYARGELSEEEYERRREHLQRGDEG